MWIRLLPLLSLSLVTAIPASNGLVPSIEPWVPAPHPPPACGAPVVIAAAVPRPHPDDPDAPDTAALGERVVVVNRAPLPVDLDGWTLRAGRRKWMLPAVLLGPGSSLDLGTDDLGSFRLRNDDGVLMLFDPCDAARDHVQWGTTEPGEWLAFPDPDTPDRAVPRPAAPGKARVWSRTGRVQVLRAAPMVAAASSGNPGRRPATDTLASAGAVHADSPPTARDPRPD